MYDKQGDVMESIVKQSLLYDFYGELLTEHQRAVYEDAVFNDMSLGEIASEQGISRQGVHDLIKRCDKILSGYEEKLHLVEKFLLIKKNVQEIDSILSVYEKQGQDPTEMAAQIRKISDLIIDEF